MRKSNNSKKLQYFMRFSILLDRAFFSALLLICFTILALCLSLYYSARNNSATVYTRKAQSVTVSLATLLDTYFSRITRTQSEFIEHNNSFVLDSKLKNKLDILAEIVKPDNIKGVALISKDMNLMYASRKSEYLGRNLSFLKHIKTFEENRQPLISSPFESVLGFRAIAVMTPYLDEKGEFAGGLCFLIDFKTLIKSFFKDIDLRDYENSWIFDQCSSMIFDPSCVLLNNKKINLSRRRFMTYALAKQSGSSSYLRVFPGGVQEKFIVCFSSIPLDGDTKWVICVEAPMDRVYLDAEGFPVVYSIPLLLFFILLIVLILMKRYFGRRYIDILENAIISSRDAHKEVESRLAAIMESFPYIIFETDKVGSFTFLNVAPEKISGVNIEELENANIKDLVTSQLSTEFNEAYSKLLETGALVTPLRVGMCFGNNEDTRIMSVTVSPIYDDDKSIIGSRGVMHEITDRVELEMNLIQSQKMDAVGMVTSGIAHDFNNYLSAILGYITMMKMKDNNSEDIIAIEKAAQNAAKLTKKLMAFSRNEIKDDEGHCVDVGQALSVIIDILTKSLPFSIKMNMDIEPNLPAVKATSSQIDQIVMNLVINARDAMPDGGTIDIKIWKVNLIDAYSKDLDLLPGNYVIFEISDSGIGLNEETRKRIFEPYFTTKKSGTGLGLASVYAIVKNIGGNILVKNSSKGARFAVYIPQIRK